jgi:hypothetical protein
MRLDYQRRTPSARIRNSSAPSGGTPIHIINKYIRFLTEKPKNFTKNSENSAMDFSMKKRYNKTKTQTMTAKEPL